MELWITDSLWTTNKMTSAKTTFGRFRPSYMHMRNIDSVLDLFLHKQGSTRIILKTKSKNHIVLH